MACTQRKQMSCPTSDLDIVFGTALHFIETAMICIFYRESSRVVNDKGTFVL